DLLEGSGDSLAETAIASTEWILNKLNVRAERRRSSELPGVTGRASQLVASICGALGASQYLTGTGALTYLDEEDFSGAECEVLVQTWRPFQYEQLPPGQGFLPDLSTLDLLLNYPDTARQLIESAGGWRPLHREP